MVYKKKFYLSEKIDLIEYRNLPNYKNLPYVFGNKDEFKILYKDLTKIKFPINRIKKLLPDIIKLDYFKWIKCNDIWIQKLIDKTYTN